MPTSVATKSFHSHLWQNFNHVQGGCGNSHRCRGGGTGNAVQGPPQQVGVFFGVYALSSHSAFSVALVKNDCETTVTKGAVNFRGTLWHR